MKKSYDIVVIFYIIDEIVKKLEKESFITKKSQGRKSVLTLSEFLTISVIGHFEQIASIKKLYYCMKSIEFKSCFPKMPVYSQFTRGITSTYQYLNHVIDAFIFLTRAKKDNLFIIDSTPLPITNHAFKFIKWHDNTATLSKCLDAWYQGYKLHLVINSKKEIVNLRITTASVHDSNMLDSKKFLKGIHGNLIGDKGYINEAKRKNLESKGLFLITPLRKNMDQSKSLYDQNFKQKRKLIETLFGLLKDHYCLLYRFARNIQTFFAWIYTTLLSYFFKFLFENSDKLMNFLNALNY